MFIEDKENKLLFFSLSTLPISMIIGATVSLINILIICLFYFKIVFIEKNTDHTLEEVGLQFSVTRERIRQIEAKALRKLKHPSRSKQLKSFLES